MITDKLLDDYQWGTPPNLYAALQTSFYIQIVEFI